MKILLGKEGQWRAIYNVLVGQGYMLHTSFPDFKEQNTRVISATSEKYLWENKY